MRTLVLLLLLANLLFAAWVHWVAPSRAPAGRATPSASDSGAIRLLREARPGEAPGTPGAALDTQELALIDLDRLGYGIVPRADQCEAEASGRLGLCR